MKTLGKWLLRGFVALIILLLLAIAAVFAVRTWLLPDLTVLQPRIEAQLSATLKQPVRLHGMSAAWNWASADIAIAKLDIGPLGASNLTVTDAKTRVPLHPLVWGEVQTDYLNASAVTVRLAQTGTPASPQWFGAGFDLTAPSDGAGTRWLLKQTAIDIQSLTLDVQDDARHWLPEKNTRVRLAQIALNNNNDTHTLKAQFAPDYQDARLGSKVQMNVAFTHAWLKDSANPKHWDGQATLTLPNANIAASTAWGVSLFDAKNTRATWRAWQRWAQQSIASATLASQSTLSFKSGVLSGAGDLTVSGLPRQGTDAIAPFKWVWAGAGALAKDRHNLSVNSPKLSLAPLAAFLQTMPLSAELASVLAQAQPKGELSELKTKLSFNREGIQQFDTRFIAKQLGLQTIDWQGDKGLINIPSVDGISGSVKWLYTPEQTRTLLTLDASQASADLPRLLAQPRLHFERLTGDVEVILNKQETRLKLDKVRFNNIDVDGQLQGEYSIATRRSFEDKALGLAQFSGTFERADLAQLHRYMPLTLSDNARNWLRHTIAKGEAKNLTFNLNGDLSRFPFLAEVAQAGERFDLKTDIEQAVLNFNPLEPLGAPAKAPVKAPNKPWPLIEAVSGELRLQGLSLSLANMQGLVQTSEAGAPPLPIRMPKLSIASLTAPVLVFQTRATAPATSVLALIRSSPLSQALGDQLAVLKTSGTVSVDANLTLDIAQPANNLTQGTLTLEQASLDISKDLPPLDQINATLAFKQSSMQIQQASGKWFGGDIMVSGGLDTQDASKALRVQGNAQLSAIKQYSPNAMAQALLSHATGAVDYQLNLSVKPEGVAWQLSADLNDAALQWPGLLDKAAGVPLPFSLTRTPTQRSASGTQGRDNISQLLWEATLGVTVLGPFKATVEHQRVGDDWRMVRGAVALGAQAELNAPDQGLGIHIVTPVVNLDRLQRDIAALPWASVTNLNNLANLAPVASKAISAQTGSASVSFTPSKTIPAWMPSVIALQVDDLTLAGRRFYSVVGAAVRTSSAQDTAQFWSGNLIAKGINGYVTWTDIIDSIGVGKGQLLAKLTELTVPASEIQSTSKLLLDVSPEQIPSIELTIDALNLGGKALGAVRLKANHLIDGVISAGWNIEQLSLTQANATLNAKGRWTRANDASLGVVKLDIDLTSDSMGDALDGLGFGKIIAGAAGALTGNVSWRGTPFALDIPSLNGNLKANFKEGQFLKVDPGAARLLSLFSLQNLPRRLTLDFKDTFSTGFAFDTITTSAAISNGVLKIDDFLMKSSVAKVSAQGEVSLEKETQDLVFTVKPEINAGSVSLLYMIINPPLGLATLAAQWLFKEPLSKAFTVEYAITGPWTKPDIKQMKREFR